MKGVCRIAAANNTMSNMTQEWIRSEVIPLMMRYQTDLLYKALRQLRTRLYMDTLLPKSKSMSGNTFPQIFTDCEGFFWIMHLFSEAEVRMALRAFARQVGIPNEMHFGRASKKMVQHSNFQCAIREFRI